MADEEVSTGSRLSGLQFINPASSAGYRHVRVPASSPTPLPRAVDPEFGADFQIAGAGRMWSLSGWNTATYSTSLLVLSGGTVLHEWYAEPHDPSTQFLGASMTKSVLSHLTGIAVSRGQLDLASPIPDLVGELAGSGYAGCRVRDVLSMTSAVDWFEDHRNPESLASQLVATFAAGGDSRELLTRVAARGAGEGEPGSRWEYNTADSQVLDWARERASQQTYGAALADLWAVLGCESDAVVGVDGREVPMAGGALAACTRDWARAARLAVAGTAPNGTRLLDEHWLANAYRPAAEFTEPGRLPSSITSFAGFGWHWWPLGTDDRLVVADGSRGQFALVDRVHDVVVVKTSLWPYDDWLVDRQCRDLSYLGLARIAEAVVAGKSRR